MTIPIRALLPTATLTPLGRLASANAAGTTRQRQFAASMAAMQIIRGRTITTGECADGPTVHIDGRAFGMDRDDVKATHGDADRRSIVNDTDERHRFHVDQSDFLITSVKDENADATGLRAPSTPMAVRGLPERWFPS